MSSMRESSEAVNEPEVVTHTFVGDGAVPNNEGLPVVIYRSAVALPPSDPASLFEALFERHRWGGSWRDGILSFDHFHSGAHEALGIYAGSVSVRLGGKHGMAVSAGAGDVIVLPAGTGHRKLGSRGSLGVVGAYPQGQQPDMCRPDPGTCRERGARAARVPLPAMDPVYGAGGPLLELWSR